MPHFECGAFNHSATSPDRHDGAKHARPSAFSAKWNPVRVKKTRSSMNWSAFHRNRGPLLPNALWSGRVLGEDGG